MANSEQEQAAKIKVVDKRRFTATGEVRPDAGPLSDRPRPAPHVVGKGPAAGADRRPPAQPARAGQPAARRAPEPPPAAYDDAATGAPEPAGDADPSEGERIEFLPFIATLATNAMAALGMLPEGDRQGIPRNPAMAREYIDIIAMLERRTRGNLTAEESQTMVRLLADLRMQYVELTRSVQPAYVAPPPPRG